MAMTQLEDLPGRLKRGQVLVGLDLGTKTVGIAVSDIGLRLATPRSTLKRMKFTRDAEALLALFGRENAGGIVLGLPVNMDGSQGPRAQATRAFARSLGERTDLPIALWDERLSTVAAERTLIEMDVSRARRAERIDSAAAAFILQGALDRLSSLRPAG